MTNTISNDIRAALETTLKNVSGIPSLIEYDGFPIQPKPGTPHVVCTMASKTSRPATIGTNPLYRSDGAFMVTLYYPVGAGASAVEAMGDAIVAAFPVDHTITQGSALVRIAYAESTGQVQVEAGLWLTMTIAVAWYVYD